MQSMTRSFGRLLNKAPGDNAKVSVMLSDFEDADKVLLKASTYLALEDKEPLIFFYFFLLLTVPPLSF